LPGVPTNPEVRKLRSQAAARTRWGHTVQADAVQRVLRFRRTEAAVRDLVAHHRPLTSEEQDRLSTLIYGGGAA